MEMVGQIKEYYSMFDFVCILLISGYLDTLFLALFPKCIYTNSSLSVQN